MRVDPALSLRRGEQIIDKHAEGLPVRALKEGLRVTTQFRTEPVPDEALPVGASRFGGDPDLPDAVAWPRWEGYEAPDFVGANGVRIPQGCKPSLLSFVAQLNLADTPDGTGLLPETGWLYFFYDAEQQPWGFDPLHRGCARVLYHDGGRSSLRRRGPPNTVIGFSTAKVIASLEPSLPRWSAQLGLDLEEAVADRYWELAEEHVAGRAPHHRLLGWPKQVQSEMDEQCQLVTHGIYCGGRFPPEQAETIRRLRAGAADWILLLQLDTDDDGPGWMWGDGGCLYFWIRKQDLAERRFENVWAVLQCY